MVETLGFETHNKCDQITRRLRTDPYTNLLHTEGRGDVPPTKYIPNPKHKCCSIIIANASNVLSTFTTQDTVVDFNVLFFFFLASLENNMFFIVW